MRHTKAFMHCLSIVVLERRWLIESCGHPQASPSRCPSWVRSTQPTNRIAAFTSFCARDSARSASAVREAMALTVHLQFPEFLAAPFAGRYSAICVKFRDSKSAEGRTPLIGNAAIVTLAPVRLRTSTHSTT